MSPRPPQPDESRPDAPRPERPQRDEHLGAALSGLPVPDHGPTFWADLTDRLSDRTALPVPNRAQGETTPVSLDEQRDRRAARRGGRLSRSLGAAAAAVALAGAVAVIRDGDNGTDRDVRAADRPTGTTKPNPTTAPATPAEFSATYSGIEGVEGSGECPQMRPPGVCREFTLTVARDGSFRWTSTDRSDDMAYDAASGTGRHVEIVSQGPTASPAHPNAFVTTGVPAGGPDMRIARPDPLRPIADFVAALARAGDSRVTATTVTVPSSNGGSVGRPAWHYDGPTVQDRLGGDGAPDHAVADVDQASGVLLNLTRSVGTKVVTRFTAYNVTTSDQIDRARYRLDPPAGAKTNTFSIGFVPKAVDEAAAAVPYDLLVPNEVPAGFTLEAVSLDRDVPSSTGPEGMNPPAKQIVAMTWRNGAGAFTVTLRPKGADQWDDPLGAEGMVPDAQPVRLDLAGRPPLEGTVVVDPPLVPHLWGIAGDIVVTVSGDLPRAELERVARSLQPHRAG